MTLSNSTSQYTPVGVLHVYSTDASVHGRFAGLPEITVLPESQK